MSANPACLTDNETKVDLLNNEAIAKTIVALLRERPDCPVTIGVHGDWGAGKSSVLEMIEAGLEAEGGVVCLKFNGWRFQGFEDAKIALIEAIVTALADECGLMEKAADAVKEVFRRIDWLKVAKKAGGLALTAFTGVPAPDQIQAIAGTLRAVLADPGRLATDPGLRSALAEAGALLKPSAETKKVPEEIGEFRKAFDALMEKAGIRQLVVLIDDLDRCLPDTAIDTLEALRLFVFTSRTAFVVAADEAMIEYAVRKHFPDLPDTTGPQTYARNYLEKLIQIPFRIPALGESETRIYVTLLLVGAELGEASEEFNRLLGAARERLRRPWEGGSLDAGTVREALGDGFARAQLALTLSEQLGPILASGTKGNPRQIKRFLNTLLLRQRIAVGRGFGDEVKLPALAKLMLAERFLPRLFDQVATAAAASPDGTCTDLVALEAASDPRGHEGADSGEAPEGKGRAAAGKGRGQREAKPPERAALTEWFALQDVLDWARIEPRIGGLDLRPYLFVTKDRKDYFGAATVLGHLASIAEQLFGPKLLVQRLEPDLKRLAPPEAEQLFESVRSRILAGDTFDTAPAGVDGLAVLVRAHPALQPSLVDFLESLPAERLGAWAVGGWSGVIRDSEAAARFGQLMDSWAAQEKNTALSATVAAARRVTDGRR